MKRFFIKPLVITSLLCVLLGSTSCCKYPPESSHPANVEGWRTSTGQGVTFLGEFVLRKGDTTANSNLGVRIAEIFPGAASCGLYAEATFPEARFIFYRVSDQKVLCDVTTSTGNRLLDCAELEEVSAIGVIGINAEEGWVHFDLRL